MEVGDYLTLTGELAIGIAGFSGVVAALTRRAADEWRTIDVVRLQMLLRQSIAVAMWSVAPALLVSSGLSGPLVWRCVSAAWAATTPLAVVPLMRRTRAHLAAYPEEVSDVSRGAYALVTAIPIVGLVLQLANVLYVAAPWPHLTTLALGLLSAVVLFIRLATVAFSSGSRSEN